MCNYIEQYKDQLENKSIDYKMNFAKKLINKKDFVLCNMLDFLDFIFYENIQENDREITMEEIHEIYDLAENIAFSNDLITGLEAQVQEAINYLQEHPPKKRYLYLTNKKYDYWKK